ncbi:hypothetical protein [Deinococcus pimensis]|nr:hypothetical protein [Deinococcus pimensis]
MKNPVRLLIVVALAALLAACQSGSLPSVQGSWDGSVWDVAVWQ